MASPAQKYARTPAPGNPAKSEAWALLESARLMEGAKGGDSSELLGALRRNWRLWTIFQASLIDAECTVPTEIRRNLLGLANFIDRHTGQLLANPDPAQVDVLININRQIGEGLLEGQRAAAMKAAAETQTQPPAGLRDTA
ncbi:MAG TPA: flagellar biosynthesis regulator FlaF [Stellaceae bacterium]|nr:flagellar biosynthesis regulator FlaF [Stellaceae bacterium]